MRPGRQAVIDHVQQAARPSRPALNATSASTQNPRCESELYATSRRMSVWA